MRLLNLISGWIKLPMADGIQLLPPGGREIGMIRIREKVRPLRPLRAIVDAAIAEAPEYKDTIEIGPLQRLITVEGEHAGIVTIAARARNGQPVERTLGIVAGDDFYALIDAPVGNAEHFATFREMVKLIAENYFLGLGEKRRRRFFYDPPVGWHGIGRAHATRFYHPEYPRHPAIITVFDARPAAVTIAEATDRILFLDFTGGLERDPPEPPAPVITGKGLQGQAIKISGLHPGGRRVVYVQVTLTDSRYAYITHLETIPDALEVNSEPFVNVLNSIETVPLPPKGAVSELIQWSD